MDRNSMDCSMNSQPKKIVYREVLDSLPSVGDDSIDNLQVIEKTKAALSTARCLQETTAESTTERFMDSYLMCRMGELALRAAVRVDVNCNVYDWHDLASHIASSGEWWCALLPRQISSGALLYGAFEPSPPEQRPQPARRRAERRAPVATARPGQLAKLEKPDEDAAMVRRVGDAAERACRGGGGALSYFHFVLDPRSFSRTVHNVYYVAFLVRDRRLALYVDEQRGIPMIRMASRAGARQNGDPAAGNQFIMSLDMKRWRELVDAFNIKSAMINTESI